MRRKKPFSSLYLSVIFSKVNHFKHILFFSLIGLLIGIFLFPDKLFLASIHYQATRYFHKVAGLELNYKALIWENGQIIFKNGALVKPGKCQAVFTEACLSPHLDFKDQAIGGVLEIKGLKILDQKVKSQKFPSSFPSFSPFFKCDLKTVIQDGEFIFTDQNLGSPSSNDHLHFDLECQLIEQEAFGFFTCTWNDNEPNLRTDFSMMKNGFIHLKTNFLSNSLPKIYEIISHFFYTYIPDSMMQWDFKSGIVNGNLNLSLYQGLPMCIQGTVYLANLHAENRLLELIGEIDSCEADLDVDLSSVETIHGDVVLQGGRLALQKTAKFWQGLWDLRNLHTQICVREGKVESSILAGNFMGMDGGLILDWHADSLIQMDFQGDSTAISTFFPDDYRDNLREVFANDHFNLKASVSKLKSGLELEGNILIKGEEEYALAFGCLFGKEQRGIKEIAENLPFSLSRSVDLFLDHVADQFCLSQKWLGWFTGQQFPLEKFLSPFLLQNLEIKASGLTDFQGTFDENYLIISYEGKNFQIDNPHFSLSADCVEQGHDLNAVYQVNLQTWDYVGVLPLKNVTYYHKSRDLLFESGHAMAYFQNNFMHIEEIEIYSNQLLLKGSVKIEVREVNDIDLRISADDFSGSASDLQTLLSHFCDSIFWEIPFEGEVESEGKGCVFCFHLDPHPVLISGNFEGKFAGFFKELQLRCGGRIAYDLNNIIFDISTDFCSFQGLANHHEILCQGEGIMFHANRLAQDLDVTHFAYKNWEGLGKIIWDGQEIFLRDFHLYDREKKGEMAFSAIYHREQKELKGNLESFQWKLSKSSSLWKPVGEIMSTGKFEWNLRDGLNAHLNTAFHNLEFGGIHFGDGDALTCIYSSKKGLTIEGLEVDIPTPTGFEKYKLGRFFYDLNEQRCCFEEFDISLPPEKFPWMTELIANLFPSKISPNLLQWIKALKQNEPLEGRLSIEMIPDKLWLHLVLKDGTYNVCGQKFNIENFFLLYDPLHFNLWMKILYQDNDYWAHVVMDSENVNKGILKISDDELSPDISSEKGLVCEWSYDYQTGLHIDRITGEVRGLECALYSSKSLNLSQENTLKGKIHFDTFELSHLFGPRLGEIVNHFSILGHYLLEGVLTIPEWNFNYFSFSGSLTGSKIQFAGFAFDTIVSEVVYDRNHFSFTNLNVIDWAGYLSIGQVNLFQEMGIWSFFCDKLTLEEVRLSRLKSPWIRSHLRNRSLLRSFFIRRFDLTDFCGNLNALDSFSGEGTFEFTNLPKKTLFTNLLFIPTEITARIGLDLTNFIPVRGCVDYKICDGKIIFNEFKDMYSEGKRSRFYLVEGSPAYIDLKGNLNFRLRMKQYNLLMKLAEFLTISIKGTLLHPKYTFSNQFEEE
ncbi:MAG: hypothetical protein R3E91_01985 [Chlamydiales bacterium]